MIDELPYLMDPSGAFESVLQRAWDRELSRKPVLLILIGSDLSMMAALTSYGRLFHQGGAEMTVGPLNPADVAAMAGLSAAAAFDAAVITGGLPILCARWENREDIAHSTLTRATDLLISKGVVAGDLPISLAPSKERRYRITDTYLRFWCLQPRGPAGGMVTFTEPRRERMLARSASANSLVRTPLIM